MKNIIFRLVPKMSIKKLSGFYFAAVALASCLQAQAQISIPKRIIQRPADSTTPGGVAVVAMPQNICTASNNNCFNTTFPQAPGGGVATIRPWTSYFLGQQKTFPGPYWQRRSVNYELYDDYFPETVVAIDGNGAALFTTTGRYKSVHVGSGSVSYRTTTYPISLLSAGQPAGYEALNWRGYCTISPTWSSNTNKLAGLPPDGFTQTGASTSTVTDCGYFSITFPAGDGG